MKAETAAPSGGSADSRVPLHARALSRVRAAAGEASEPRQTQVGAAAVVGAVVID